MSTFHPQIKISSYTLADLSELKMNALLLMLSLAYELLTLSLGFT